MSVQSNDPPADITNQGEDALRITYAGAKRRIAALEKQLLVLQEGGTKRKSDTGSIVTQGRVICRLVSMFQSIEELIDENDRRRSLELDDVGDDEDASQAEPHTPEQCRTLLGYNLIVRHIPGFEEKLVGVDIAQLGAFIRDLRKGAGGARGDDAANLKPAVINWIITLFDNTMPPLLPHTKSDRGFEHDVTGRLLCPIQYDWDVPHERQSIRDGHPNFVVEGWPAFLWPHAKANKDNLELEMFQSAILVKAFKFIFTSPTSAQDIGTEQDLENQASRPPKRARSHKAPTRGNVASLLGMRSVTPRSIAYVAVQLRFALSSAVAWNENDGCFSYAVFYNDILDFFEAPPGPASRERVQALLDWWTRKIFGNHRIPMQAQSQPGSSTTVLVSQRAARELANGGRSTT